MSTLAAITTTPDMRILPGGTCIGDPDQMTDDLVDLTRNDLDTASDPSATPEQRAAAHKRLVPFMATDDHERLHRSLSPRAWKAAGTPRRHVPQAVRPTRAGRCATQRRASAFSAGSKQASSSSSGDDGPLPPRAAERADHPQRSVTGARQIGGAR
jgi:hypothetical protein